MSSFLRKGLLAGGIGLGFHLAFRDDSEAASSRPPSGPVVRPSAMSIFGIKFINPVDGGTCRGVWGDPRAYRNGIHRGIDIYASRGTPIVAVASGTVSKIGRKNDTTAGRHVYVKTYAQGNSLMITCRYLHMDEVLPILSVGDKVDAGMYLGTVGATYGPSGGNTSPHLHFDMAGNAVAIGEYKKAFGEPKGGFDLDTNRSFGVQFPAEPFIPTTYTKAARERAASRNIPVLQV